MKLLGYFYIMVQPITTGPNGGRRYIWSVPNRFVGSFAIVCPKFQKWLDNNTQGHISYLWRDNLMGLDIASTDPSDIILCRLRWEGNDQKP